MREVWPLLIYQSGRLPSSRLVPFSQSKVLHSTRSLHTRARVIHIFFASWRNFPIQFPWVLVPPIHPTERRTVFISCYLLVNTKDSTTYTPLHSTSLHSFTVRHAPPSYRFHFARVCYRYTYMAVSAKIHPFMFMNGNENFCFLAIVLLLLVL